MLFQALAIYYKQKTLKLTIRDFTSDIILYEFIIKNTTF